MKRTAEHQITKHYNQREDGSRAKREKEDLICMKRFHNFLKAACISEAFQIKTSLHKRVLDLACGKGGDLTKWVGWHIDSYLGIDAAKVSLQHAQERCKEMIGADRFRNAGAEKWSFQHQSFAQLDLRSAAAASSGELSPLSLDLISCQFALHYAFESKEIASHVFENIQNALVPGGVFFGIIPDMHAIQNFKNGSNRFVHIDFKSPESTCEASTLAKGCSTQSKDTSPKQYFFSLQGCIDDCPEFLIDEKELIELGETHHLKYVKEISVNLHEFYHLKKTEYASLAKVFQFINAKTPEFPVDQWEISGLYRTFFFIREN